MAWKVKRPVAKGFSLSDRLITRLEEWAGVLERHEHTFPVSVSTFMTPAQRDAKRVRTDTGGELSSTDGGKDAGQPRLPLRGRCVDST